MSIVACMAASVRAGRRAMASVRRAGPRTALQSALQSALPVLVAGDLLSACADSKRGSLVLRYLTTVEVISTGERVEVERYAMCFDAERGRSTFILSSNEALWVPTSDGGAIAVAPPIIHDCSTFPRRSRLSPQVAYYPDVADLSVYRNRPPRAGRTGRGGRKWCARRRGSA